ncbi:MAG: YCF48-related protein [Bacteroidota bacterium]|nr:YCF48-related protein [Bacteroidota bacterium]
MNLSFNKALIVFALFSSLAYSQPSGWKFQHPYPDGEYNTAIKATNNNVFVCGLFGKIIKSTNGGLNWNKPDWQTIRNFFAVDFIDDNNGIVAGGNGDIFKTTNGGENWLRVYPSDAFLVEDIKFISSKEIVAVGRSQKLIRSDDEGNTWKTSQFPERCWVKSLSFNKNRVGLACGAKDTSGVIFRTTDGGITWKTAFSPHQEMGAICFVNENIAFAVGRQTICKTTDAGLTWSESRNKSISDMIAFSSISFATETVGIITGTYGVILRTTDAGDNWLQLPRQNSVPYTFDWNDPDLNEVAFCSNSTGYIVGAYGTILKTTDAGRNWIKLSNGKTSFLSDIKFIDASNGVAVGGSSVVVTTNGGKEWIEKNPSLYKRFTTVKMLSPKHISVLGTSYENQGYIANNFSKKISSKFSLAKIPFSTLDNFQNDTTLTMVTFDGGNTWKYSSFGNDMFISAMDFGDDKNGIILGFENTGSIFPPNESIGIKASVFKTTDGGLSWLPFSEITAKETFHPFKVKFFSSLKVLALGEFGLVYESTDGGKNWHYLSELPLKSTVTSMYFLDELNGFVSTLSGIYKTSDGGKTWSFIYDCSSTGIRIHSVNFPDINNGYAVGEGSTGPNYCVILRTTDGGQNWSFEYPPTVSTLYSVFSISPNVAYAAGYGGAILTNLNNQTSVNNGPNTVNRFTLLQNYPNPFNPSTIINYEISKTALVKLTVYNSIGEKISELVNEEKTPGRYSVRFDGRGLSSGLYFYSLVSDGHVQTNKMILLK